MEGYVFRLYSDDIPRQFHVGDRVFVWLKSNRSTGLATIVQTPDDLPCESPFAGRYLARYDVDSNLTAHVRPDRLYPVYNEQQQILVCYHTDDYRRLARSQVNRSDTVLELGCSYGVCTNILAEHADHVTGIDNSEEAVAEARRRYPRLQFEVADALQQPAAVLDLIKSRSYCSRCSSKDDTHSSSSSKDKSHSPSSSSSSRDNPHSNKKGCCSGGGRYACTVDSNSSSNTDSPPQTQLNSTSPLVQPSTAVQSRRSCCCSGSRSVGPCSVVFVDIGGDRQLEALLRLIPWVMKHVQPRLLVVKSEELAISAEKELSRQQQQGLGSEVQQQQELHYLREQQGDTSQESAELQQVGQQQQQQQGLGPEVQQQQYRLLQQEQQADTGRGPAKLQQQQQRLRPEVQQHQELQREQQADMAQELPQLQQSGQQMQQQQQYGQYELQHEQQADIAQHPIQPQQPGQQQQQPGQQQQLQGLAQQVQRQQQHNGQQELQQEEEAGIAQEPAKLQQMRQQLQQGLGPQVQQQELQQEERADAEQYPVQLQQPAQQLGQTLNQEQHLEQQEQHQQRQQRQQLHTTADQQLCQQLPVLQCSNNSGGSRAGSNHLSAKAADECDCKPLTYGVIQNPKAWWDQLEIQQGVNPLLHSGKPEQWFLKARAQGFVKKPLRYPQRFTAEGVRICRPHNYDRCTRLLLVSLTTCTVIIVVRLDIGPWNVR